MESLFLSQPHRLKLLLFPSSMYPLSISSQLRPRTLFLSSAKYRFCCKSSSVKLNETSELIAAPAGGKSGSKGSSRTRAKVTDVQLKENWLSSLSCPFPSQSDELGVNGGSLRGSEEWVIGVDPDVSGALALLKTDHLGCSAQVFDSPYVQTVVGKKARKRLDAKSLVQLVQSFNAPMGTTVYIEQSIPLPMDGKQGWWGGGFGYGLWIGILVASGFSVVPVPSASWKNEFELCGSRANKDSSRMLASELFPSVSEMLKRKKDHGRAEALLLAAYGQRRKMKAVEPFVSQESIT